MAKVSWDQQLHRIYIKGRKAFEEGKPLDANPYNKGERSGTGITCPGGNLQKQRWTYWSQGWTDCRDGINND